MTLQLYDTANIENKIENKIKYTLSQFNKTVKFQIKFPEFADAKLQDRQTK